MKRSLLFAFLTFLVSALSFGQLSEGFETWPPSDWTIVQGPCSPTNDITQSSSQANSGTYSARFSSFSSCGSGYDEYLITPQLVTTSGDQTFSFWYRKYTYGSEVFKVGWSSTGTNVNTDFTWGPEISDASTSWQQYSKTDLPIGTKYVAIHYYSDYQYYLYIDDVAGPALYVPSCPPPSAQTENNITSSSVDLGWTTGGSTQWQIEYGATGFTQGSGTTVIVNTTPAYNLTGLTASTDYDWYVRDICGVGDSSAWVGPSSFTTACAIASTLSEDFSSSSTPVCWDNSGTESWLFSTGAGYGAGSAGDHTTGGGTNYAWIDGSSGVETNALITPFIDLSGFTAPAFEFYYFSNNTNNPGDNNTLTVSFYDGAAWNTLLTYSGDDASWQQGLYDLSGYTITGDVQFRFVVTGTASTTYYNDILVDDISVKEMPTCPPPSGLAASEMTTTTARLAWNPATGASGYDWEVVPLGNAQGTGVVASGNVSDTTVVASGLTSGTTYDAYVQAECGSGYIGPLHFATACPAKITTFPYATDFENAGSIANCWTNDPNDAGGEWEFVTDNSHGPSGDHTSGTGYYALLDDYLTHSYESPFNLLTPVFDLSTHDKWYKVSYWAWIGPDGATNPIYFEISLDGGATWETLYTHDYSTTEQWFKVEMDLGFKKSDNVQFRFRGESIYGYSTDNSGIDDFTIEETQAPPVPLSDWAVYTGIFFILLFMVVAYRRRLA